jgi:hypothetical protein
VAVVQVGGSLRRGGHITGALVLFAAAAVAFAARVQVPADRDALPLAPAIAVLTAEGVYALLAIGWRALGERRRPLTSP